VSDVFGALGAVTLGTEFDSGNKFVPLFTVTAGATPLVATDTLVVNYKPFIADALVDGRVYPDKPNAKRTFFRIVSNTHAAITAAAGSDMTAVGATDDEFLVEASAEMAGGRDGIADLTDADYTEQAWDTSLSVFNRIVNKNLGIIKFATPGVTSTSVQKAGKAYAEAKNHQYRYEAPASIVTEEAALDYFNDTLGRSDFAVCAWPSYGSVADPEAEGDKLKVIPLTGMIHGREARMAADWDGYHKAEAGEDATLPALLDIPTGDAVLNEELLNPSGVNVIKKIKGNYVIWGDRTLNVDPTWKWKHQREQMSYYEHVLQENFGWIIFSINDAISDKSALVALRAFFKPEWQPKRALRGDKFEQAAIIKVDEEINTDATRDAGDKYADVSLRLADTTERFIIKIGKQGIFESVG
jgi:phage tail sheath protein FI